MKANEQYVHIVLFFSEHFKKWKSCLTFLYIFVSLFIASYQVRITGGCAETTLGDRSQNENLEIPSMSWIQTPSIVDMGTSKIMRTSA